MSLRREAVEDFAAAAYGLLGMDSAWILLSGTVKIAARTPWPPLVFLDVFRHPRMGLLATLLNSQPLFSPLVIAALMFLLPIGLQAGCLFLLARVVSRQSWRIRLLYPLLALLPIFGPAIAHSLMKSFEDVE